MSAIEVRPLSADRLADFLHFFDRVAFADNERWQGCYCYFHYHDPAQGAWHCRSADRNRQAMVKLVEAGRAQGLLAYKGDEVVGWCNAAPRELFPVLRRLPGNDDDTAFVPCFLVAPDHRRRGLSRQLLRATCETLARRGFRRLLGKPVRGVTSSSGNAFGPLAVFLEAGFSVLFEDERGNVYVEKTLEPPAADACAQEPQYRASSARPTPPPKKPGGFRLPQGGSDRRVPHCPRGEGPDSRPHFICREGVSPSCAPQAVPGLHRCRGRLSRYLGRPVVEGSCHARSDQRCHRSPRTR